MSIPCTACRNESLLAYHYCSSCYNGLYTNFDKATKNAEQLQRANEILQNKIEALQKEIEDLRQGKLL